MFHSLSLSLGNNLITPLLVYRSFLIDSNKPKKYGNVLQFMDCWVTFRLDSDNGGYFTVLCTGVDPVMS